MKMKINLENMIAFWFNSASHFLIRFTLLLQLVLVSSSDNNLCSDTTICQYSSPFLDVFLGIHLQRGDYPARALRALGLLLSVSAPTVRWGKTFYCVGGSPSRKRP